MTVKKKTPCNQSQQQPEDPAEASPIGSGNGEGKIESPEELADIEDEIKQAEIVADESTAEKADIEGDYMPAGDFLGDEACANLCSMVFSSVAARRGKHWELSAPEAEQIGGALDAVLAKYLPSNMDKYGPEIVLGTLLTMIILPRLKNGESEPEKKAKNGEA